MDITTILSALSYWFLTWIGIEAILAVWTLMVPAAPVAAFFEKLRPAVMIESRQEEQPDFATTIILRRTE